jgi:hypothetical protein
MEKAQVVDFDEKSFSIREDADGETVLELICNYDVFHLISEDSYVMFKNIEEFVKKDDDIFTIIQDSSSIVVNREEYDMIYDATLMCKREGKYE